MRGLLQGKNYLDMSFGLNIVPISTKFIQCQLTIRNCINNFSNEDLKFIIRKQAKAKMFNVIRLSQPVKF